MRKVKPGQLWRNPHGMYFLVVRKATSRGKWRLLFSDGNVRSTHRTWIDAHNKLVAKPPASLWKTH